MTEDAPRKRASRLTRERVVATALRIIDEEGTAALSMRRLAAELDRDPMRLYAHAANKEALLDHVVDYLLQEFEVAKALDGDWEQALRETAHRFQTMALRHPHMVPLLVTRGLAMPFVLRPLDSLQAAEDLLDLFATAGFDERSSVLVCHVYISFLQGHALSVVQQRVDNPDETEAVLRYGLHRLPLRRFPHLRSLGPFLASYDDVRSLDESLEVLFGGFRAQLRESTAG